MAGNFGIETDIQLTADGEAMVHHDDELGRLTEGSGALLTKTAAELKRVVFKGTPEKMMSLAELCALVAGRVPLVIEVKSHFNGDRRLVRRMAEVLSSYDGLVAAMSFDPDQVLALRELIPARPRGIVAQRDYTEADWPQATPVQRDGDDPSASCLPHPAAFCRLLGGRTSSRSSMDCAKHFPMSAADMDSAHAGTARPRRQICRSDGLRGFPPEPLNLQPLTTPASCPFFSGGHRARGLIANRGQFKFSMTSSEVTLEAVTPSARFRLRTGTPAPVRRSNPADHCRKISSRCPHRRRIYF